jgi:hypothetical protein
MKGRDLEGKTYGEILNDAKDIVKEQKELAAKVAKEEKEKQERFGQTLTVALFDKGYAKQDFEDYITYSVAFENKSDKEIRAVKGTLLINDLFDAKIKSISITFDDGIPAKQTVKNIFTTDFNQFNDEDKMLVDKDLKDLKIIWFPGKIIFADGTTLE